MKQKALFVMQATALSGVLVLGTQLRAQDPPKTDNTKVNSRGRAQPTADQGRNNSSDLEKMKNIRKAVVADKSLSTYAHNVKIIAQNGKITLKGPVRTEAEKVAIEAKAIEVAGTGNVTNMITIKDVSK